MAEQENNDISHFLDQFSVRKKMDENGICRDCYPKKNLEKRRKSQDIAKKII